MSLVSANTLYYGAVVGLIGGLGSMLWQLIYKGQQTDYALRTKQNITMGVSLVLSLVCGYFVSNNTTFPVGCVCKKNHCSMTDK